MTITNKDERQVNVKYSGAAMLDFIRTVGRLIEIGHDYPNFMEELYTKGFRLEFMGVETRLPLGAEEWDLISSCLRDIADLY